MSATSIPLPPQCLQNMDSAEELTPKSPAMGGNWQHPPSFICPISQQIMHDPVVVSDGHTYERRHIERWLQKHTTSPVTNEQLKERTLFPNHALRNAISEYFDQVFSAQRRAIRKSIRNQEDQKCFGSDEALMHTIDTLMQCAFLVNADLNTVSVLQKIINEAKNLVGAHAASVFLVDEKTQELYSRVNSAGKEIRIPISSGIAGHVATTGEPLIISDAYADERFNRSNDLKTGFRTHNILCVPLKAKKGAVIGVVQLINKNGEGVFGRSQRFQSMDGEKPDCAESPPVFTSQDLQFLQVFASQAALTVTSSGCAISEDSDNTPSDSRDEGELAQNLKKDYCQEATKEFEHVADDSQVADAGAPRISSWADESQDPRQSSKHAGPSSSGPVDAPYVNDHKVVAILESAIACSKARAGFFESVARPLFHCLVQAVPSAKPLLDVAMSEYQKLQDAEHVRKLDANQEEPVVRKKSGRSRQRAAKYWSNARCRTPSPEPLNYSWPLGRTKLGYSGF